MSSSVAVEETESKKHMPKIDWKQNEYVKMATEISSDMVTMVKESKLTKRMKSDVDKLKEKVKEERAKKETEEKEDPKERAKKSWSWLTSKTKGAFAKTMSATKTYFNDVKEEFKSKPKWG